MVGDLVVFVVGAAVVLGSVKLLKSIVCTLWVCGVQSVLLRFLWHLCACLAWLALQALLAEHYRDSSRPVQVGVALDLNNI